MAVQLDHVVVVVEDAETSARWFADLFDLDEPEPVGSFWQIVLANDVAIGFVSAEDDEIFPQHYAFLVSEPELDAIYRRMRSWDVDHWADPAERHPGEINHHHDGGRSVYFQSNDGHAIQVTTRPHRDGG